MQQTSYFCMHAHRQLRLGFINIPPTKDAVRLMFIKGKGRSVSYPTANHPSHRPARTGREWGGPCIPAATLVLHHPLERPVRLTGSPDSAGYSTGCRGDSATAGSPGNTPLCSTESLVAQPRWGNPQGQMPGHVPVVRFANREPAAVIQTVVPVSYTHLTLPTNGLV